MSRAGPQKARSRLVSKSQADQRRSLTLLPAEQLEVPDPPANLLKKARETWAAFWRSDVARAVQPSDHRRLFRWIEAVDQLERLREQLKKQGMFTEGSKGQPRLNPLLSELRYLEGVIDKVEEQFGMTPQARLRLGLDVDPDAGKIGGGVDALNRAMREAMERAESSDDADDGFDDV